MLLFCPMCSAQHVDAPEPDASDWDNPPHRTHQCKACGHRWQPCDSATNGVTAISTSGNFDGSPAPYDDSGYAGDLMSLRKNVNAALESMCDVAVRVHEGAGHEDLSASLALSAAAAMKKIGDLEYLLTEQSAAKETNESRYAWLRDRSNDQSSDVGVTNRGLPIEASAGVEQCGDLDAAVDTLMAREEAAAAATAAAAEPTPFDDDDIPF